MKSFSEIIDSSYQGEELKFEISQKTSNVFDVTISRLGKSFVFYNYTCPSNERQSDEVFIAYFLDFLFGEYQAITQNSNNLEEFESFYGYTDGSDLYQDLTADVDLLTSLFTPHEIESWQLN